MNEYIERVAKALSIADGNHPDACSNDEEEIPAWTLYVDDARAALSTVRAIFYEKAMATEFEADSEYQLFEAVKEIDRALK